MCLHIPLRGNSMSMYFILFIGFRIHEYIFKLSFDGNRAYNTNKSQC